MKRDRRFLIAEILRRFETASLVAAYSGIGELHSPKIINKIIDAIKNRITRKNIKLHFPDQITHEKRII